MDTENIRKYILATFTFSLVILLVTFVLNVYWFRQRNINEKLLRDLNSVKNTFQVMLEEDAEMMSTVLETLIRDEQLQAALRAKDRKSLLKQVKPFEQIFSEHRITHFYFNDSNRVNILRVHKPTHHGDTINRFTTLEAERSGKIAWGIELGQFGTFTLRVVTPLYDSEGLIGYVELGEEINHLVHKTRDILDVELYIVIFKEFLIRENWEAGMRMLGREAKWDRFPSLVVIDQTLETIPESISKIMSRLSRSFHETPQSDVTSLIDVFFDNCNYRSGLFSLEDAAKREVGKMVVLHNITNLINTTRSSILNVGGISLAIGGILFAVFYVFLGRVEQQLKDARLRALEESRAREAVQLKHIKEISMERDKAQSYLDIAAVMIIALNKRGEIILINQKGCSILGYELGELVGKNWFDMCIPKRVSSDENVFFRKVLSGDSKPLDYYEITVLTKCGEERIISWYSSILSDKSGNVAGTLSSGEDITDRKKTLDELTRHEHMLEISERNLKKFSRKILSVREDEKRKLSNSLHDELGSITVALSCSLSIIEEETKDNNMEGVFDAINQTKNLFKESVEKLKRITKDLRPPNIDIVGISNVLRQYFSNIAKQAQIKIDFIENMKEKKLSDELAIVLYRVSQEALNNIIKHAGAKKVKVKLCFQESSIELTIRDDGKGFDTEEVLKNPDGFGLQGMREWTESSGGTFIIKSAPKEGTEINATIPNMKEYDL